MALDKAGLKSAIEAVLRANQKANGDSDPTGQIENSIISLANGLANAIDLFVKSGTVTTTVTTAGSPNAHTGTGTGNIT